MSQIEIDLSTDTEYPIYWIKIFELLSSDITKALYPEIGLKIADKDSFIQQIRHSLSVYYKLPQAEQFDPDIDKKFAEIALKQMSENRSKQLAICLYQWVLSVFNSIQNNVAAHNYWIAVLLNCKWDDNLWNALGLPQDRSALFKQNFLNTQDNSQFLLRYESASQPPRSEWDLYLINKSIEENEADDYNFLESLELQLEELAEVVRCQHFWQWVTQSFSAQEIDKLHRNAERVVKQIDKLNFIEQLTHPSRLLPYSC